MLNNNILGTSVGSQCLSASPRTDVSAQIVTFAGQTLNNYLMYMGGTGVYAATMVYDRE